MGNKKLPNSSAVLVLGILSICFCAAWGLPGLAMGIVALVLYKKDKAIYITDPEAYEQSYKNATAGKICAIIGVTLSALTFVMITLYFILLGTLFASFMGAFKAVLNTNNEHYRPYEKPTTKQVEKDTIYYLDSASTQTKL